MILSPWLGYLETRKIANVRPGSYRGTLLPTGCFAKHLFVCLPASLFHGCLVFLSVLLSVLFLQHWNLKAKVLISNSQSRCLPQIGVL